MFDRVSFGLDGGQPYLRVSLSNVSARIDMSLERKPDLHLEVAHVLFMDVVGFSKLLINDQTEILDLLNQIVRKMPHFREAEAAGKLIRLATGDGMALVFSNSAEAPVECALEIS